MMFLSTLSPPCLLPIILWEWERHPVFYLAPDVDFTSPATYLQVKPQDGLEVGKSPQHLSSLVFPGVVAPGTEGPKSLAAQRELILEGEAKNPY